MNNCVSGIARHKNNLRPRTTLLNLVGEFSAVLSRQYDVGQQQIEFLVSVEQPKGGG